MSPVLPAAERGAIDVEVEGDGDVGHVSVSTILGVLAKDALVPWAAYETADAAIRMGDVGALVEKMGVNSVRNMLAQARFDAGKDRRSATELGQAVHALCEQYALTGTRPEADAETAPFLDRFEEWCDKAQPEYLAAEVTVFNETYGYAGTADAFMALDGITVLSDYKTSRNSTDRGGKPTHPWPEAALQLAGLRHTEFAATWRARRLQKVKTRRLYLLSDAERALADPVPPTQGGVIIHITPEHCTAHPMVCDERVWEFFLHALELWRWNDGLAKVAVGPAIEY